MIAALRAGQWRRVILAALTVGASLAILGALIYRERDVLRTYDWDLQWSYIAASCVVLLVGLLIAALIWADMMHVLGSRVTRPQHLRYYAIAHLARRLPGTLWYVAGRSYLYKQHGDSLRLVGVASGLEMIVSVASGAVVTLAFIPLLIAQLPRAYLVGLGIAAAVGVTVTQPAVVSAFLRRMGLETRQELTYGATLRWFNAYALVWLLGGLILFLIAAAITPLPWSRLPFVTGAWCLVGVVSAAVFFLPSNLGITEVGLSLLLSTIMPSSIAVLVAIMTRILITLYEVLGLGIIVAIQSMQRRARQARLQHTPPTDEIDPTQPRI